MYDCTFISPSLLPSSTHCFGNTDSRCLLLGDFMILDSRWPPAQEASETVLYPWLLGGRCDIRDMML